MLITQHSGSCDVFSAPAEMLQMVFAGALKWPEVCRLSEALIQLLPLQHAWMPHH